jgi:hypothetical protein
MGKFTKTELLKRVAAGEADLVEHAVKGVQLEDGNIHWLQDHDEEAMDGFIGTYDERGVIENRKVEGRMQQKARAFFKKQRTIGATIEHLLNSPLIAGILKDKGVKVDSIKKGLEILNWGSADARIKYIIRKVGSERANEVYAAIEAARDDGKITKDEWLSILRKAGV